MKKTLNKTGMIFVVLLLTIAIVVISVVLLNNKNKSISKIYNNTDKNDVSFEKPNEISTTEIMNTNQTITNVILDKRNDNEFVFTNEKWFDLTQELLISSAQNKANLEGEYNILLESLDEFVILPPSSKHGRFGNFEYALHKNGKVQLLSYSGNSDTLIIPDEIDGAPVTYIGNFFLSKLDEAARNKITSLILGKNVASVGAEAFNELYNLKSLELPDSLLYIQPRAFMHDRSLTALNIPRTVKEIGSNAFAGCGFKSLTVPSNIKAVSQGAFGGCAYLDNLTIENGVKEIGNLAFSNCGVTNLVLPPSIEKIDSNAFCDSEKLKIIKFTGSSNSKLVLQEEAFSELKALEEVSFENGLCEIEKYAFLLCKNLKKVTFPATCKSIGQGAFAYCSKLKTVDFESKDCYIDVSAFQGNLIFTVHAPKGGSVEEFFKLRLLVKFEAIK